MGSRQSCCSASGKAEVEVVSAQPSVQDTQAEEGVDEEAPNAAVSHVGSSMSLRRARMESKSQLVVDKDVLRGIRLSRTLRRLGALWLTSPADLKESARGLLWEQSQPVESLDRFLSHTWWTSGRLKLLALLLQNGWPFMLLCYVLAAAAAASLHFSLSNVQSRLEKDREFIYKSINDWYGSEEAFTEHVRGPLKKELLASTADLPVQYSFLMVLPFFSVSLDALLGCSMAGVSVVDLLPRFFANDIGWAVLWFLLGTKLTWRLTEIFSAQRSCRAMDYATTCFIYFAGYVCWSFVGGEVVVLVWAGLWPSVAWAAFLIVMIYLQYRSGLCDGAGVVPAASPRTPAKAGRAALKRLQEALNRGAEALVASPAKQPRGAGLTPELAYARQKLVTSEKGA
ncbi:unnamed protein product [Effrenium voratum]|uniref:Transmembrane protein n=1 Tax=Effrenium voratum TaxID=2562239 RepID=A0AA36HYL7_9DINO|nr:unnamed protein product [Effrenium voratum]